MAAASNLTRWLPFTPTRRVSGPTENIVIVGAGLAGLSAAMRLAAKGCKVTVVERESIPGGRAGRVNIDVADGTYRFDNGPTVLTMPDLIADAFDALGERMEDWLTLEPIDPLYRAFYADGSILNVRADVPQMAHEIWTTISAWPARPPGICATSTSSASCTSTR